MNGKLDMKNMSVQKLVLHVLGGRSEAPRWALLHVFYRRTMSLAGCKPSHFFPRHFLDLC